MDPTLEKKSSAYITKDKEYYLQGSPRIQLVIEKGSGAVLTDLEGKEYIDCFAGIAVTNAGHAPKRLMEAAKAQMEKLVHASGRFFTIPQTDLVEKIAQITPAELQYTFLCNSGAEAVENGVKLAKKYAVKNGKPGGGLVALEMSFHGRLGYSLSLTGHRKYKKGFSTYANASGIVHAPVTYAYRSKLDDEEFGEEAAKALEKLIDCHTPGDIGAFIMEPILGEGGIIVPPDSYFQTLIPILKEKEILLFIDEVQTGFGRTGKMFASEYWNLQPDIFAIAKGMASGMPIAGTTVVPKVADAVELGDFFSTFGGNPVCSAVALENIKILEEDNLIENAEKIGKLFFDELENTQKKFEIIGDVRGKGLMIGIELVKDRSTKTPAKEAVDKIGKYLQKEGILIGQGGFYGNVLRLQPPLVITEDQANRVMSKLNAALAAL